MKYFTFLFFIALAAVSCDKDEVTCPKNIICTEEYRMINVSVNDTSGNPVDLDIHEVYIQGSLIPFNLIDNSWQPGTYLLVADDRMNAFDRHNATTLRFDGYLGGELVIREYYQVKHDCCHVILVSGNTNIVLAI